MRANVEREVKLVPGDGFRLPELGRPLPERSFVSTYHDTADLRLARHGVTLRHRLEGGAGVWQLKLPRGAARLELEEPGPPARPPRALVELLAAHLRDAELVRVARLRTRRQGVRADGAEVVEDSVAVLEGQRVTARFRELEVELVDGDEKALRRLERALRDAGAEPGGGRPKLYRALDLAFPVEPVELPPDAQPLDVLGAALRRQYESLLAHDPGTRLGSDPEDLHQLRVATRRSRAFLRTARPIVDHAWSEPLREELGWLGAALGPARDLDVLLDRIRADLGTGSRAKQAAGLVVELEREHASARDGVLAALSDERYFRLLDRLESLEPVGLPGATATLPELWWDSFRRARRAFGRLDAASADEDLHSARIDVKRARYAAELAGGALGRPGERFVSAAKTLQDVLGEHQDAVVAEARIRAWAETASGGEKAVKDLIARERRRRSKARKAWPAAWDELERRARRARP
jgi:CHAD domain-containing protein